MTERSALPLAEISVIELGNIVSAPFASLILADLGADVVKVERPQGGDIVRNTGDSGEAIINAYNRNKRSIALDLQTEEGKQAYYDLTKKADVVIENLGAGVVDRLDIGYSDLYEVNPELVYLSIKGFQEGPYGNRPGMDMVAEAMSGLAAMTGNLGDGPVRAGTSIADIGAAMYGVIGILIALRERDQTGEGQQVDATLFESVAHWMGYWMTYADMTGTDHPPLGSSHPSFALYDIFETNEPGNWVFVGVTSDRHWPAFCEALNQPNLLSDNRFETPESRLMYSDELVNEVQEELETRDRENIIRALLDEGVPVAPVNKPSELLKDKHLKKADFLASFTGYHKGETKQLRTMTTPLRGDRIRTAQRRGPPQLGEHGREILGEAGYDDETITALLEQGVVDEPEG